MVQTIKSACPYMRVLGLGRFVCKSANHVSKSICKQHQPGAHSIAGRKKRKRRGKEERKGSGKRRKGRGKQRRKGSICGLGILFEQMGIARGIAYMQLCTKQLQMCHCRYRFWGAPIATQCFVHFPDKRTLLTLVVYQSVISQYSYSTN